MARLYLDENIGSRILMIELGNAHHSATFCRDLGYAKVPDDFHLYTATLRNEVLMTHDADFLAFMARSFVLRAIIGFQISMPVSCFSHKTTFASQISRDIPMRFLPRNYQPRTVSMPIKRVNRGYSTGFGIAIRNRLRSIRVRSQSAAASVRKRGARFAASMSAVAARRPLATAPSMLS